MGEKGISKYEKELIKKRKQAERDQFDMSHLGNFRLVYPALDDPVLLLRDRFSGESSQVRKVHGASQTQLV